MSTVKSLALLGTTCIWMAIAATVPLNLKAQEQPTEPTSTETAPATTETEPTSTETEPATTKTDPAPSGTTEEPSEFEVNTVNQVSDLLANKITGDTCPDFAGLLSKVQTSGGKPVDESTVVGQLLGSVRSKPALRSIVVDKVGEPLITKLIDCNMIPVDALVPTESTQE